MEGKAKIRLTIDGEEILADEGTTILEAAQQSGIHIPTLCHHHALSSRGGCRICVVEVDGAPRLVASCVTPVRDGMDVVTSNDRIIESRRTILEFLFAERNHNCMFCPQSGDCELQKLAYELQMDHLTVSFSFNKYPTDISSEYMAIDHNRCILCGRCVRACQEIAGNYVLNFQNRGPDTLIALDLNETREESTCYGCGVCMQVCPTGAIYNRYRTHYAVKGHPKDWQEIESFCPRCGLLCPTISLVQDNHLLKIDGDLLGDNGRPDRGQLCYKGRFEAFKSIEKRLLFPMVREKDGRWIEESWENALDLIEERLSTIRAEQGAEALFGLASSMVSNEELFLFRNLMVRGWSAGYVDTLDGTHFRTISRLWEYIGENFKEASWKLIPDADFILVVGANPYRSQPVVSSLIRRSILEKGTKLGIIGSLDSMYPLTSYCLPVKQGDESSLLKALLAETIASLKEKPQRGDRQRISEEAEKVNVPDLLNRTGMDEEAKKVFHGVVDTFIGSENPLIIAGEELTGLNNSSGLLDTANLTLLKGLLPADTLRLIILKPYGNSVGAWKLGISSAKEMSDNVNSKGGLMLLGGEEISDPDILDILNGLDFLAVISPYFPESLAHKAHLFIPSPLWMEEDGTYTSLDGREIALKKKVLNAPDGVKDSCETLMALAERIGFHPDS
ncbi:MAG: molybdopterin-dependent oxidoreductase [Desulfobacteraceae bacterium]|nr:molybdopterin-dependent oxidoreductase [Desulfobacteraceae bacterium]